MTKCAQCYGSAGGVCKNTETIFKDKECPFYVCIFDTDNTTDNKHRDSERDGDNL